MKKRTKILAAVMAMTLVVGSLTGCGGDSKESSSKKEGGEKVFNITTPGMVVGLNPLLDTTQPDNQAHNVLCEPLVRSRTAPENSYEIVPGMAEKWDVSEDGKTYTFHLREGKWNDGSPLTAKDFEYTLKKMADPATAATSAWLFEGVITNFSEALYEGKPVDEIGVKAIDDKTLEIQLVFPASYFLDLAASIYPVSAEKYEEWGADYGTSIEKTLYSGPFKIESWSQNTEMVLVPNENYWQADKVKLDKLNLKVINETATAIQAFINGELDVVSTSDPNWTQQLEAADGSQKYTVPDSAPEFFMFNMKQEYLSNKKIRQALTMCFDRQKFIDDIWNGVGIPLDSVVPDTVKVGEKTYTELVNGENKMISKMREENPDAKALLIEGLKELGKDTDPSKVTLRYASRGTTELSKKMAEWMKQTWEEALGITVEIDMMEWNIMWDRVDAGDYDIATAGWGPYYNEPSAIFGLFEPEKGYFNADKTGWNDEDSKKFAELLASAENVTDPQEKANIYLQLEEILVGGGIICPTYLTESPTFVSSRVEGYYVSTNGQTDYTQVDIK